MLARAMSKCRALWTVASLVALSLPISGSAAPLEAYGRLPSLEDVSLSPDGSRIAFVKTTQNTRLIEVASLADRKLLGGLRVGDQKLREVSWADDNHLLIVTSDTALPWGLSGMQHEWWMLQVYDVLKQRTFPVPDITGNSLKIMNVISGRAMVRRVAGHTMLYVPGVYVSDRTLPMLIRCDLDTHAQIVYRQGSEFTRRWLVDGAGEVAAEQDYRDADQEWSMKILRGGRLQTAASGREPIEYPQLLGFGPTEDTLLMQTLEAGDPVWRLMSIKDGTLGPPMAERLVLNAPIEDPRTYRMIGGVHIEDDSHYVFFDPAMQRHWDATVRAFKGDHVRLQSASADFHRVIVRVEGPQFGYQYQLVDFDTHRADPVGDVYEGLTAPLEVRRINYAAADSCRYPLI